VDALGAELEEPEPTWSRDLGVDGVCGTSQPRVWRSVALAHLLFKQPQVRVSSESRTHSRPDVASPNSAGVLGSGWKRARHRAARRRGGRTAGMSDGLIRPHLKRDEIPVR
jgi:hypothetical protein